MRKHRTYIDVDKNQPLLPFYQEWMLYEQKNRASNHRYNSEKDTVDYRYNGTFRHTRKHGTIAE